MVKRSLFIAVLACACAANAAAQDAKATVGAVSKALGADALKTVQYSATGFDFALGQKPNPSAPWPKFIEKSYTRAHRLRSAGVTRRSRACRARTRRAAAASSRSSASSRRTRRSSSTPSTPWVQQLEIWMMPHGFLRAAATRNATVAARHRRRQEVQTVITFVGDNKAQVNGYINEQNLVERVETMIDNPFLGDMPFEAVYSDYKDVGGGVQFPMHIVQKQGGYPIFDLSVTDVKVNAPVNIQPPQGRGGAPAARRSGQSAGAVREAWRRRLPHHRRIHGDRRRLQGLHRAHRMRPERGARAGRHRRSQAADSRTSRSGT